MKSSVIGAPFSQITRIRDGGYQSKDTVSKVEEVSGIPFIKAKCNARILAKGHPEWKRVVLKQILVRRLDYTWVKLVLGDEYQHIHRAIMNHSVKISPGRDAIHLRDTFIPRSQSRISPRSPLWMAPRGQLWRGAYSLSEFAALIRHADAWERGWMLGRTMELVEVETLLATLPLEDYQ